MNQAEEIAQFIKKEEKKEWMLPASIVFAAVVIAAAFVYSSGAANNPAPTVEQGAIGKAPEITAADVVRGNSDAKVTIIEFGDFQCPYCGKFFNDVAPFIKSAFVDTGKAKLVYKPLAFLGQESENSATAVACAQEQGKFWEMHDGIFTAEYKEVEQMIARKIESSENNGNLNLNLFTKIGKEIGLDQNAFTECFNSGKKIEVTAAHMREAQEVMTDGISTPTVYINGKKVDPRVLYDKQALTVLVESYLK
ncbi:MAG: hypothetical protein UX49_C0032G0006 [Candidatus Wolfebacteria bacterium GW2011_GWC2_46_275]|nr:MAG: hypothetical protein UX49_C0032G0006 [Candidatus Wolfebacteria bacterium GW2011_GWC2_46_275]KKU53782.1 MAG: hypothetical protein UX76_C0010G0031 [Candidatus Wolfebacteria bacterium GW2011_GWC1_47_103]KKU59901.1 MAG: hypothetical protein UX83_C0002G0188 [Candidatus Wolfebacteria bacterium GW2011_GWE2_47_12]KKU71174.1 MAG: hypothetical protein UX96_C0026G0006 [Candidatus Wolfebacteria bacterium GW2011_GWB1_47_243]